MGAGRAVDPPTWGVIGGHRSVNEMFSWMSPLVLPPRSPFSKMNVASVAQNPPEVPINSPIGAPFRGAAIYVGTADVLRNQSFAAILLCSLQCFLGVNCVPAWQISPTWVRKFGQGHGV